MTGANRHQWAGRDGARTPRATGSVLGALFGGGLQAARPGMSTRSNRAAWQAPARSMQQRLLTHPTGKANGLLLENTLSGGVESVRRRSSATRARPYSPVLLCAACQAPPWARCRDGLCTAGSPVTTDARSRSPAAIAAASLQYWPWVNRPASRKTAVFLSTTRCVPLTA